MAVNKYPGQCFLCGGHVPAKGGLLHRVSGRRARVPVHLSCADAGAPTVIEFRTGDGRLIGHQNRAGRCEDAPCCGCCS